MIRKGILVFSLIPVLAASSLAAAVSRVPGEITVVPGESVIEPGRSLRFEAWGSFEDGSYSRLAPGGWRGLDPVPTSRGNPEVVVLDGKVHLIGGWGGGRSDVRAHEIYDPVRKAWSPSAELPDLGFGTSGRYGGVGGMLDGKIHVAGGWRSAPALPTDTLLIYDPAADSWSLGPPLPVLSGCSVGGVIGRRFYVLTGCDGSRGFKARFDAFDAEKRIWIPLPAAPRPHAWGAAAVVEGRLVVFGGRDGEGVHDRTDVFDPATGKWTTLSAMPEAREHAAAGTIDGEVYIAGGRTGAGTVPGSVFVFDPRGDAWRGQEPLPSPRFAAGGAVVDGRFYVFGGTEESDASDAAEVLLPENGLRWAGSDPVVLAVGPDGDVTGVAEGSALLTASVGPVASAPTTVVVAESLAAPPPRPGLVAETLPDNRVRLIWSPRTGDPDLRFHLFADLGPGGAGEESLLAVLPSTASSYLTSPMEPGTVRTFILKISRGGGAPGAVEASRAWGWARPRAFDLRMSSMLPGNGASIYGNAVTVLFGLEGPPVEGVREVLFQFRREGGTWTDLVASPAGPANPVLSPPFMVRWDTTRLLPGTFDLRAVISGSDAEVLARAVQRGLRIDPARCETREDASGRDGPVLRRKLSNTRDNWILAPGTGDGGGTLEIRIPAGSLAGPESEAVVSGGAGPPPGAPDGYLDRGLFAGFSLTGAGFAAGGSARVLFRGGATANLSLFRLEESGGVWRLLPTEEEEAGAAAESSEPGLFAAFAPMGVSLGSFRMYPNPYRPGNGDRNDGVDYDGSDPQSGIVFDRLPDGARLRIFSMTGGLVAELGPPSGGTIRWDARTRSGFRAASGMYFAAVEDGSGASAVRKLLIVR